MAGRHGGRGDAAGERDVRARHVRRGSGAARGRARGRAVRPKTCAAPPRAATETRTRTRAPGPGARPPLPLARALSAERGRRSSTRGTLPRRWRSLLRPKPNFPRPKAAAGEAGCGRRSPAAHAGRERGQVFDGSSINKDGGAFGDGSLYFVLNSGQRQVRTSTRPHHQQHHHEHLSFSAAPSRSAAVPALLLAATSADRPARTEHCAARPGA